MASFLEKAVRLTGRGFDIERRKLMPPNSWIVFLSRDGRNNNVFFQERRFDKSFVTRSNTFRSGFYVEIAVIENLQPVILKSSHFSVNGQCYAIADGDTFPPSGDRFSWMIYGTFTRDVYTPTI